MNILSIYLPGHRLRIVAVEVREGKLFLTPVWPRGVDDMGRRKFEATGASRQYEVTEVTFYDGLLRRNFSTSRGTWGIETGLAALEERAKWLVENISDDPSGAIALEDEAGCIQYSNANSYFGFVLLPVK